MKLALIISLLTTTALISSVAIQKRKSIGPCMPYAAQCLHCSDCSECQHCAQSGGKCSVCFKH
jgi:hypothetical protein